MKFLLNMNVHRDMLVPLRERGHVCRHVGDIGMSRAKDVEIVAKAKTTGETILTHDLDYGHLLAFSGESAPSVIILRLRNLQITEMISRFDSVGMKSNYLYSRVRSSRYQTRVIGYETCQSRRNNINLSLVDYKLTPTEAE